MPKSTKNLKLEDSVEFPVERTQSYETDYSFKGFSRTSSDLMSSM